MSAVETEAFAAPAKLSQGELASPSSDNFKRKML
jgi:hypothetical protein